MGESEGGCQCLENHLAPAPGSRLTALPALSSKASPIAFHERDVPPLLHIPLAAMNPFLDYRHPPRCGSQSLMGAASFRSQFSVI